MNEWKIVTGQTVNHGTQDGLEVIEIDQLASGWVLVSAALSIQIAAGQLVARRNLGYGNEASVANLNEGDQFTVISHNERSRQTYQVNKGAAQCIQPAPQIEGLHFNLFTRDDDNDYEPVTDRTAQLDRYEDVFIGVAGTDRGQKRNCWFVVNHLAALGKLLEDHRIANNSVDFENIEFYAVRNPWLQ